MAASTIPQQVYDGAIAGTCNVLAAARRAGTVRRFAYTSSFAAVGHPAPSGYRFTEKDWASDNREQDPNWNKDDLVAKGEVGYAMAKVELEHKLNRVAAEDGRFESVSICPLVVLGPLVSRDCSVPLSSRHAARSSSAMHAQTPKQDAIQAIQQLPDDVPLHEIVYRLQVLDKVRQGLKDIDAGHTFSSEELARETEAW